MEWEGWLKKSKALAANPDNLDWLPEHTPAPTGVI